MNLVWHIVKKDFTRLRLPLLLWTGLLFGCFIAYEQAFSTHSLDSEWVGRQVGIVGAIALVWIMVCYILVAAAGLDDSLVGTTMFWATRPISGGRLLAAKLLGVALFFILWPVLISAPWWLRFGFGMSDIYYGALPVMTQQVLVVLPALTIAALAGQSSRFLLWTLVAMLAMPMGVGMVAYNLPKGLPRELIGSRISLVCVIALVTTCTIIWLQYRSRRLARSIVVTVTGAVLAVLIGLFWPWDVTSLWPKDTSERSGAETIAVTFGEATRQTKDNVHWVTLTFMTKGTPRELAILSGEAQLEFRWPDGTTLKRSSRVATIHPDYTARSVLNLPPVRLDPATEVKRAQILEARRQSIMERGGTYTARVEVPSLLTHVDIPAELVDKFATPPTVKIALRLQAGRAELLAEIPLKEGATQAANGLRLKLLRLETVQSAVPDQPATQMSATIVTSQSTRIQFVQFLLVDRVHGTVSMEGDTQISSLRMIMQPLGFNRLSLRLNIPQLWRDDKWIGAPEWLENDTIAAVTYSPDGGFTRELQADRLEFAKK